MDFLRECATELDEGASAASIRKKMETRYTTLQCLNVKMCKIRQLCQPDPTHIYALKRELENCNETEREALIACANKRHARGAPPSIQEKFERLPPRLMENARQLCLTHGEMREIKRMGIKKAIVKNKVPCEVDAKTLLEVARRIIRSPKEYDIAMLSLALLLVTGRRSCEVLSGKSTFSRVLNERYHLHFLGQAKARGNRGGVIIPILEDVDAVLSAYEDLRRRQSFAVIERNEASRRYQSLLSRSLHDNAPWSQCQKVHGLRGIYTCISLKLFSWKEADAYVAMKILGHVSLKESLVYTPYKIGPGFDQPLLGRGPDEDACGQT